jgi:hypothetical protein
MGLMVDIAGRPEEGWYATAHNVPSDDDATTLGSTLV